MKNNTANSLLLVLFSFFISCSSSDDEVENVQSCSITSVNTKTLYYEQIIGSVSYNPNFSGKIKFEYNLNGQIIKMIGGPVSQNTGIGNENIFFTDDLVNEVSYQGNTITAQNKYGFGEVNNTISYTVDSGKLTNRKVANFLGSQLSVQNYQYEYVSNQIIEKKEGALYRTFYFTGENLTKVEQILYANQTGQISGKIDIILSNYDSNENLLQGKYFVNGAFFKAFSKNNFRKFEKTQYNYIDGQFVENGIYKFWFDTFVDQNGLVDLFERTCN